MEELSRQQALYLLAAIVLSAGLLFLPDGIVNSKQHRQQAVVRQHGSSGGCAQAPPPLPLPAAPPRKAGGTQELEQPWVAAWADGQAFRTPHSACTINPDGERAPCCHWPLGHPCTWHCASGGG